MKKAPNLTLLKLNDNSGLALHHKPLPDFQEYWFWRWVNRTWFERTVLRSFARKCKDLNLTKSRLGRVARWDFVQIKDWKPVPRNFEDMMEFVLQG